MRRQKSYEHGGIEVRFEARRDVRAAARLTRATGVLEVEGRPWSDAGAGTAAEVVRTVERCPPGASTRERADGGPRDNAAPASPPGTSRSSTTAARGPDSPPVAEAPRARRRRPFGPWLLAAASVAAACDQPLVATPEGELESVLEVVVDGLVAPVHLTAPVGDARRVFVVQQRGLISVVRDGQLLPSPFLDITALVGFGGERGLLSLAFDPAYAGNGHFYVNYTDPGGTTRVVRYTVSANPDLADPASAREVISVAQPFGNHNGGQLAFGPDGMLYIGMGDGGSPGDPLGHGQNRATLLGSILRVDVSGGAGYTVPPDNPFVGNASAAPETWAYGLRNPWRFSFDRQTGDLYIGDVGQGAREEVSFQPASSGGGENYGWNVMEGTACYQPPNGCPTSGLVLPIHEYDHGEGCSITGGHVYRGPSNPSLTGRYFFADYCSTWIRSFRVEGGVATDLVDHEADFGPVPSISSFGEDGVGELYVVSLGGTVYRITAQAP